MGSYGGIIWFVVIGALFFWMMKKGGCGGGHSHGGGVHNHGGAEGHENGESTRSSLSEDSADMALSNHKQGTEKKKSCH